MRRLSVILLILLLLSATAVYAGEETANLTARSFGMGGAYTALAEGIEASLFNPAAINDGKVSLEFTGGVQGSGLSELKKMNDVEGNITRDDFVHALDGITGDMGLNSQLVFGAKLKSLGLTYNIKENTQLNYNSSSSADFSSLRTKEAMVTYGRKLLKPPFNLGYLAYGINLKMIDVSKWDYSEDNYTEKNGKGNGFGIDLGLMAKVTDNLRIGCKLGNIVVSKIPLNVKETHYNINNGATTSSEYSTMSNDLKKDVRIGAALTVPVLRLTLAADIDNPIDQSEDGQVVHIGLEKNLFFNALSLRAGKISSSEVDYTTLGLGLNLSGLSLDMAAGKNFKEKDDNLTFLLAADINY